MVHYTPEQQAAPALPPICPKCGSHRTEVVGRSSDAKTLTVRCNSCGERSVVTIDHATAAAMADTTAEIEAIRAVSCALTQLHDPAARLRVLNWAYERFGTEPGSAMQPARTATPAAQDQMLAVGDLGELFSQKHPAIVPADLAVDGDVFEETSTQAPAARGPEPEFESLVRSFVNELTNLAREWGRVFSPA